MTTRYKINCTIDGEMLWGIIGKFLPFEHLHVEEVVERPKPATASLASAVKLNGAKRTMKRARQLSRKAQPHRWRQRRHPGLAGRRRAAPLLRIADHHPRRRLCAQRHRLAAHAIAGEGRRRSRVAGQWPSRRRRTRDELAHHRRLAVRVNGCDLHSRRRPAHAAEPALSMVVLAQLNGLGETHRMGLDVLTIDLDRLKQRVADLEDWRDEP